MPPFSFSGTIAQSESAATRPQGHRHRRSGAVSIDLTRYSLTPTLNTSTTPASAAPRLEEDGESFVVDLDDALVPTRVPHSLQDGGARRGRARHGKTWRSEPGTEMEVFREEDEDEGGKETTRSNEKAHGLGIDVQPNEPNELRAGSDASFQSTDINSLPETTSVVEPQSPLFPQSEEASPVEIVDGFEGQPSYITGSTNRFSNDIESSKRHQTVQTHPYALPHRPFLTPETPTDTTFSTPQFDYPDDTYTARRNTNTSSFTTSRAQSARSLTTPARERYSVDDVPSLISSRSTMTSAVHAPVLSLPSQTMEHAAITARSSRNASVVREQHSKRSSIASLSKLIRGGSGDRGELVQGSRSQTPEAPTSGREKEKKKGGVKGLLKRVFKKREA